MKKINKIIMFLILCITFNLKALAASPDLVVTGGELGTDYTYEDGVVSIINSNSYEISMAEGIEESSDQIVINYSDTLKTINLTLNNVNLKTNNEYNIRINYPLSVNPGDLKVNLILKGNNSLMASHHPYSNPRILGELIISSEGGSLTTEATEPPTDGYNNLKNDYDKLQKENDDLKKELNNNDNNYRRKFSNPEEDKYQPNKDNRYDNYNQQQRPNEDYNKLLKIFIII